MAVKNKWGKTVKKENAYYAVSVGEWTWYVLKMNGDPTKKGAFASALTLVVSPLTGASGDMGDTYVKEIPGLLAAWKAAHEVA